MGPSRGKQVCPFQIGGRGPFGLTPALPWGIEPVEPQRHDSQA